MIVGSTKEFASIRFLLVASIFVNFPRPLLPCSFINEEAERISKSKLGDIYFILDKFMVVVDTGENVISGFFSYF